MTTACTFGLVCLQCGGSERAPDDGNSGGTSGSDGAAMQATGAEFVGTWRTGTVRELGGDCYPQNLKDQLPPSTYEISLQDPGGLMLGAYNVPLRAEGSTATMVGEGSLSGTIVATGSVVTNHLSNWSLTLGTPAVIEYSGTIETTTTSGTVTTCTVSLVVEATSI